MTFVGPENIFEKGIFSLIIDFRPFFQKNYILIELSVTLDSPHCKEISNYLANKHWYKKSGANGINTLQEFLRRRLSVHFGIENLSLLFATPTPI